MTTNEVLKAPRLHKTNKAQDQISFILSYLKNKKSRHLVLSQSCLLSLQNCSCMFFISKYSPPNTLVRGHTWIRNLLYSRKQNVTQVTSFWAAQSPQESELWPLYNINQRFINRNKVLTIEICWWRQRFSRRLIAKSFKIGIHSYPDYPSSCLRSDKILSTCVILVMPFLGQKL